jgi:hypothetical protein
MICLLYFAIACVIVSVLAIVIGARINKIDKDTRRK